MKEHRPESIEMSEEELNDTVAFALRRAQVNGADQSEAALTRDFGITVTARLRDIETLEYQNDRGFGITVYFEQRKGSASTSDFSHAAIDKAVDKACSIARQTTADEYAGLPDEESMANNPPRIALDFPWSLSAEDARELAIECECAALDSDSRISNSEGASVASGRSLRVYANSHGFHGSYWLSRHSISCAVIAGESDSMERDYHYSVARDPQDVESGVAVGKEAGRRAVRRLNSRRLTTREAPVLFPAELARGLFGHAASAMAGGAQYRRASFLLDGVGEQLFPKSIQWDEEPHLDKALASAPFDSEGVATQARRLVADGRFQGYILSSYSARRLGLSTTGNAGGLHNVIVASSDGASTDLMSDMGRGFMVTELMGQGVNPVTGDYSRGAAGFWVENGEPQYPVSEITIAGNLRDMYSNIIGIGDDVDRRGVIQCGSVLLSKMTIAGE